MATAVELRERQQHSKEYDSVLVTPEVAAGYLRLNNSNRPLRKGTIERLTRLMIAGLFKQDHPDHITFDEEGFLINGQHRLHAIVRSQKPQQMRVLRHVPREMAHVIDVGLRRTVEDSVWIARGTENVDRLGLKLLTRFVYGGFQKAHYPYTREQLVEMYDKYGEALSAVAALFIEHKQGSARACIRAAVARAWVARTKERTRLRQFVATLCTGHYTDPDEDSAAMLLRDHLLVGSAKKQLPDVVTYRRVSWAIGKFLGRKKITKLGLMAGEQFRLPEDEVFEKEGKR